MLKHCTLYILFVFLYLFTFTSCSTSIISQKKDNKDFKNDYNSGSQLFYRNCATCHSLYKMIIVGPSLNSLGDKHNKRWVMKFLCDEGFRTTNKTANDVIMEYNNIQHPDYKHKLTKKDISLLIDFIQIESDSLNLINMGMPGN